MIKTDFWELSRDTLIDVIYDDVRDVHKTICILVHIKDYIMALPFVDDYDINNGTIYFTDDVNCVIGYDVYTETSVYSIVELLQEDFWKYIK